MVSSLASALIILGFGSVGLTFLDRHVGVVAWAEPAQPYAGIGIGVLGLVLLVAAMVRRRRRSTAHPDAPADAPTHSDAPPAPPRPVQRQYPQVHFPRY